MPNTEDYVKLISGYTFTPKSPPKSHECNELS